MANEKNINEAALNEKELENISGGMTDWRQDQARAAARSRTAVGREAVQSKNKKTKKTQADNDRS
jgi:bacteriocin-like protein